ncbi:MAG: single-stranded-DNA-specific exonuclease RecJ [Bacteroidetes bacterium GWF2_43_63]|nr:MAG: single-stranded-DNA-specific exonuclease RecJ [Bacteroidetes bacterium GWE2_42_42]OFY55695.1 MAG: single-stranded-DNA-specific exonuclease RecJ [Bacteroidetes bacterium GWF2_43_63]HBG69498.1 single-stranded-DNA-specific exonuclease RecJ [Bacteroidales bacterium]HCB61335.1 single-stranded-DNA-specific exonuclease RecJ [Bacteroidales bacterium]HCY24210.1 single-stranded-DNA-specific exonuclease RecJ [Bacteroidales bacterium]
MLAKRWILKDQGNEELIRLLMEQVNVNRTLANLLVQRGIDSYDSAKAFFRPSIENLHDPFLMKDMDKAVDRLVLAIDRKESILLYGDYDVDGTTAVAIVYKFLKRFKLPLDYYIPDRFTEGYGISIKGIDYASETGCSLIIAVDCGIKDQEKVLYATEKGIDCIICDHHRPGDDIPDAVAVLDPKQKDCNYPFEELSGAGVGFKLMQGLAQRLSIPFDELKLLLDLVTLSIAADIVPVIGENRILSFYGLKMINSNPSAGIEAILRTAGVKRRPDSYYKTDYSFTKKITISDLVFIVGPRVNAAGRIQSGKNSVDLLISENADQADIIATQIDNLNIERKSLDSNATTEALLAIAESLDDAGRRSTVLFNPAWPKGILGIVASRLTEHYYKPTIVFTRANDEGVITGSARSIKDFDIYEAVETCSDLLIHWGGHTYAAGLSLKESDFETFRRRFDEFAQAKISDDMMIPVIEVDSYLDFNEVTKKFYSVLKQFAPFGPGNMNPVFQTNRVYDNGFSKLVGNNHIKLMVTQSHYKGVGLPGIAFQLGEYFTQIESQKPFDIVYALEENEWNGNTTLQLNIKDIRIEKEKEESQEQ